MACKEKLFVVFSQAKTNIIEFLTLLLKKEKKEIKHADREGTHNRFSICCCCCCISSKIAWSEKEWLMFFM